MSNIFQVLPLTFPIVCLEFRPIMGSVTTPLSLPLSENVEERRQAVPTCPGRASPWTTCSPRSSCEQRDVELVCLRQTNCAVQNFQKHYYLKELKGELKVVWVHGVDAVLCPLRGPQAVPTFRLRVA